MNELYFLFMILLVYASLLFFYKTFGKVGVFAFNVLGIVLANIFVLKQTSILGFTAVLSVPIYAATFFSVTLLTFKYGPMVAKKTVYLTFFSFITFTILIKLIILFPGNEFDSITPSLEKVFGASHLIFISSLSTFLVSHVINIFTYTSLSKFGIKSILIKKNISIIIAMLADAFTFITLMTLVFNILPKDAYWDFIITNLLGFTLITILDNPFLLIAKKINPKDF